MRAFKELQAKSRELLAHDLLARKQLESVTEEYKLALHSSVKKRLLDDQETMSVAELL